MAANTGDSYGECEQDASDFSPLPKQMQQNSTDGETQQLIIEAQHRNQDFLDSGVGFSYNEATIFANDSKSPSAPSEPEAKLPPQRSPTSQSGAPATQEQRLLEGTVHQQPGGTVLAEVQRCLSEDQQAPETGENEAHNPAPMDIDASTTEGDNETVNDLEFPNFNPQQDASGLDIVMEEEPHVDAVILANPLHQSNTEELGAREVDSPDVVVAPTPVPADQNMPETYSSPEIVAIPSEDEEAVNIAEKMNPAHLPQFADLQVLSDEFKNPMEYPVDDANDCCMGVCSMRCKYNDTTYEPGYKYNRQKCFALWKGVKSVYQYWVDGFTPRCTLLLMFSKIFLFVVLSVVAVANFAMKARQGEYIVFDSINFACSFCGCIVSLVYTVFFCIRRRREVRIILRELCTCIALTFYKCCCCCTIRRLEKLKKRKESSGDREAAKNYVDTIKMFKPAQNCLQKSTACLGNASEIWLTIVDDLFLTTVFILSLYNFMGRREFNIFYGSTKQDHILGLVLLVLSALKLIFFVHGIRLFSITRNVRALDKKVEKDSKVMGLKLPNKCIRYCFSFPWRVVYHAFFSSVFQLYGIFALSWKIIQDSCSAVAAPSILMGNGTNGSHNASLISSGAPFTCNLHTMVNGFTIYNILYIVIAPTLLGHLSLFICNTPWLVEYMQTITMWTCLQIEYMTGVQTQTGDEDAGQGGLGKDNTERESDIGTEFCRLSEKDAYISPRLHLVRIFFGNLLCDRSAEDLGNLGANAERIRQAIYSSKNSDNKNSCDMLGQVMFYVPAAIIGALQVILFIVHLSFMGCCVNGDVYTILLPYVQCDIGSLFILFIIFFLLTSFPGPWIGLFWIFVVIGILITVAFLVALAVAIIAIVVALLALVVGLFVLATLCSGSGSESSD